MQIDRIYQRKQAQKLLALVVTCKDEDPVTKLELAALVVAYGKKELVHVSLED